MTMSWFKLRENNDFYANQSQLEMPVSLESSAAAVIELNPLATLKRQSNGPF